MIRRESLSACPWVRNVNERNDYYGMRMVALEERDKAYIIADVWLLLSSSGVDAATARLRREYKFDPEPIKKRKYGVMKGRMREWHRAAKLAFTAYFTSDGESHPADAPR